MESMNQSTKRHASCLGEGEQDSVDFSAYVTDDEDENVDMQPVELVSPLAKAKAICAAHVITTVNLRCPRCNTFKPPTAFAEEMLRVTKCMLRACLSCVAMTPAQRIAARATKADKMQEQQCGTCRVIKPLTEFRKRARNSARVVGTCKSCTNVAGGVTHKTCHICKELKLLSEFKAHATSLYGVRAICKPCCNQQRQSKIVAVPEKKCKQCGETQPATSFSPSLASNDGLFSFCKPCAVTIRTANDCTKSGFLQQLVTSCKLNYGDTCTLPRSFAHECAAKQNDECAYSGISLNYGISSSWQASIEAMVPALGHVPGNCVLIALELNIGHGGWSTKRVVEHLKLRHQKPGTSPDTIVARIPVQKTSEHRRTRRLLHNARANTDRRNSKRHRADHPHQYLFTFQDVCALVLEQDNRCHWSGQPMDWSASANHWAPSFERLDVMKGYVPGNVRLVCRAFNALDFTTVLKHTTGAIGRQGWSTPKYATFFESVCQKYSSQLTDLDKQLCVK